ncbi:MAG: OadG family protein [Clostridia bacterium]|nr:OadG family protein [Clostridia bacterium]
MDFDIFDALVVSLIGVSVVMSILAIIAVFIILISKVIRVVEAKASKAPAAKNEPAAPAAVPAPEGVNNGEVELIGTDEKTAAVIMAIVSEKCKIPLNRLSFKSIRLLEDEKKGAGKK